MTPEQFRRVEDAFFDLRDLPPKARGRAIAEQLGDDAVVRAEVESLLKQHDARGTTAEPEILSRAGNWDMIAAAVEAASQHEDEPQQGRRTPVVTSTVALRDEDSQAGDGLAATGADNASVEQDSVYEAPRPKLKGPAGSGRPTPISTTDSAPPLQPGQRVGDYEVIQLLGQGGMGMVYLARDAQLHRLAALKAVRPQPGESPHSVERLRREARALAAVSHRNVATIYGLEVIGTTPFLAMEFVEGPTLAHRLSRKALPIAEALSVCEQLAAGVGAAHGAGVIHRDLKPGNVMLTVDGVAKVLDFGLARASRSGRSRNLDESRDPDTTNSSATAPGPQSQQPLTRHGAFFGTPGYVSPEQARGDVLDARSDIFSFGLILFRCLAGRGAFVGETDSELLSAVLHSDPDWSALPARVPGSVRRVLRRCLEKRPEDRYQNICDARLDLLDALADREWDRPPAPVAKPVSRSKRLLPWSVAVAASVVAVGAIAYIVRVALEPAPAPVAQTFDVPFPESATQADLERLQLAIAPDGRTLIAACSTPGGGQSLWARTHREGKWARLDRAKDGHRPFFSPDGQWVGFFRENGLFRCHLTPTGEAVGDAIRIADATNWNGANWVSGERLAFVSAWGQPLVQVDHPGAVPEILSKADPNAAAVMTHLNPHTVPGGRWLLYDSWSGGDSCEVMAIDLATRKTHRVLAAGTTPHVAVTPRGHFLLYERASILFAMRFDTKTATVNGAEYPIVEGVMNDGTRFAAYFDVAADGTLVYIPGSSFEEQNQVATVNDDGQSTTRVLDDALSFCEPRLSRDGEKLFVILKGKQYRGMVYDLKRQTSEPVLAGGDNLSGDLSPDGRTLACSVNRDGVYGIILISLDDGSVQRVFDSVADYPSELCWSPDGQTLTFSMSPREGVPRDVWVVEAARDRQPRGLIASGASEEHGQWSPDGKWLAYTSDASGRREVYVLAMPEGVYRRQVSVGGGAWPHFSPDGKALYFRNAQGLQSVELSEGGATLGKPKVAYVKPFGQSDPLERDYTIAPDGRILLIEPSPNRPTVEHIRVVTDWYGLLP
jgi:serine/threonine protein kinase/Tol biopolymer transport system component